MSVRICPECGKAFFMSLLDDHARCPHCGVFIADRRTHRRERKELQVTLSARGSTCRARTTDFSRRGAGITFAGMSLEKDAVIVVTIDELRLTRQARMVWQRRATGATTAAGIELM